MEIRQTRPKDLDAVMEIYRKARAFMEETGNATQWVNGYPSTDLIQDDIAKGHSYICLNGTSQPVGVFYFAQEVDPTYLNIYEGAWLNNEPYGVIHRIASNGLEKGVAAYCINWCLEQWGNIRIDTHRDNIVMQKIMKKCGFDYCGIIYLEDGAERLAYQKII